MQKPLELFAFVLAHALGRPLMYPGSTTLLNAFVWDQLTMARAKLVEEVCNYSKAEDELAN